MSPRGLGYLAETLTLREQSHRRATLVGIGALLLLATSPVFGHHVLAYEHEQLLAGVDHIGTLCLTALHLLLAPVHRALHIAFVAGLAYAGWNRFQAWRLLRGSLTLLDVQPARPGDAFWTAASVARIDPALLRIVSGLPVPAFTAGFLRPRIYVAEALSERLAPEELAAVVAHEGAHVARRDPLRLTSLRALAHTLFWIPALRRLAEDMTDQAELAADDAAAGDRPLVLASAILRVAHWPAAPSAHRLAVGFAADDLLERRVRRLAGEDSPVRSHVTRRSLAGAAAALAIVWTSGVLMAHPMPSHESPSSARHCDHRRKTPIEHLFCLGSPFAEAQRQCPHHHA